MKLLNKEPGRLQQTFSWTELEDRSSHNSAIGPDNVHSGFLKQLPKVIKIVIQHNDIWIRGKFLEKW